MEDIGIPERTGRCDEATNLSEIAMQPWKFAGTKP